MALNLRNIISMEDDSYTEEVAPEVAEAAVDEVEATEASEEIIEETEAMDEYSEELDETVEDVQELEQTQEVLETAMENPDYEGMDEVAAEEIGQKLRRLARKRGFDVNHLAGTFSKESFNTRTSGRRRRTEIAMEGIKDAIVKMWERIKAAIKAIWQAIKDFWKKHISTMGRLLKALEKAKRRARDINGSPDAAAKVKVSPGLQRTFFGKENLSAKLVKEYTARQKAATGATVELLKELTRVTSQAVTKTEDGDWVLNQQAEINADMKEFSTVGTEDKPLVNGFFPLIEDDGSTEDTLRASFKWDQRAAKPSDNRNFNIASSKDMVEILDANIDLIKHTQHLGDNFSKASTEYDRAMNKFSQGVNTASNQLNEEDTEEARASQKALRATMDLLNWTSRLLPKINSKVAGLNVACAKGALSYCNTSMANYKEI